MRLFISLNPETDTLSKINSAKELLKDRIKEIDRRFIDYIKWENADKFHLTMFFIGEADANMYNDIKSGLKEAEGILNSEELNFSFKEFNAFPNLKYPRVLFLDLLNENEKVFLLSDKINSIMNRLGFKNDKKFYPHITLGRVKRDRKINLTSLNKDTGIIYKFSLCELCLMQSKLSGQGSEYTAMNKYILIKS